jgi:predicted nicotinamide N-methyase
MEEILNGNQEKRWQLSFRGEMIVMHDIGGKILKCVDKFREVGDIIIQFDPGHAALSWAGFRFLLKVRITNPSN